MSDPCETSDCALVAMFGPICASRIPPAGLPPYTLRVLPGVGGPGLLGPLYGVPMALGWPAPGGGLALTATGAR